MVSNDRLLWHPAVCFDIYGTLCEDEVCINILSLAAESDLLETMWNYISSAYTA